MTVVGILTVHLTGAGRQQVLQGAKTVLNPMAPLPCPDESRPADGRVETHQVELLFPGCTDHDERHSTIRRTHRPQPCIAHPRHLRAVTPGPLAELLQVVASDLPPICQREDIATLSFDEERTLVGGGHM